ncbi:MAG: transglutaminase-like domain-containing protein [Pseudomonadota bacterium]
MFLRPCHFILCLLLTATAAAIAQPGTRDAATDEGDAQWMAVFLDGQRAGHMRSSRQEFSDRVESSEEFLLRINRSGITIEMLTEERYIESPTGEPLGFFSRQQVSGGEMTVQGEIRDGKAYVTTVSAGTVQEQTFDWPEGAVMAEGARLAGLAAGLEPGAEFKTTTFVPSALDFYPITTRVIGEERVDLLGTDQDLYRMEETTLLGNTANTLTGWLDEDYELKKARMSIMGLTVEAIACPEACATGNVEPADIFVQALVESPSALPGRRREDALTYYFQARGDGDVPLYFAQSREQTVEPLEDGTYQVTVRPEPGAAAPLASPTQDFFDASRWLQIEAPEIHDLVRKARGDAVRPADQMRRFEAFVKDYVSDKNLSVGYASALEVARNRSGDCTEHALLLAAMGRAAGIPTRVATGLAYVDNWLGNQHVFVPHAWTQAWLGGRWVSFDAALGGFDAGHIALAYGNGDPASFYDGISTLGNLTLESVEAAAP